jgi:hypothetical protein
MIGEKDFTWNELRTLRDALKLATIKAWEVDDRNQCDQFTELDGKVARMVKAKHLEPDRGIDA